MSGPKSYHYQVDAAVLRAQQEAARLAAERSRLEAAGTQLVRDHASARRQYGEAIPDVPLLGTPANTADAQRAFNDQLRRARAELDEGIRASQQASMLASLANAIGGGGESPGPVDDSQALARVVARVHTDSPEEDVSDSARIAEAVARNLGRIPPNVPAAERARIESAAREVLERADEPNADLRVDGLRAMVAAIGRDAVKRLERGRAVDDGLARLTIIDDSDVSELRSRLEQARAGSGALAPSLEAEIQAVELHHARRVADDYVGDVLASALSDLGYEVGPRFETKLASQGFADVNAPAWTGYGVRVRVNGQGGLAFNVVRGEGNIDSKRDAEVEHSWCSSLPSILERLEDAGVESRRVVAIPAGAQAVQVDSQLPRVEDRRGAAAQSRELRRDEQ